MARIVSSTACIILMAIALVACGGGGGSSPGPAANSLSTSVVSKGMVTAKGSIFVNGIEYSTSGAIIKIDDNPGTEADLRVGMVVKVKGSKNDTSRKGTATEIEARDALEGIIDDNGVDPIGKTVTVMGQVVKIEDNVTRLNDDDTQKTFASAGFRAGDVVEVHGFPDDQGGLRATRVVKKGQGEFEIKGFITAIGVSSFSLSLSAAGPASLTVNFNSSLPAGAAIGSLVEVKSAAAPAGGVLTATRIKLEDNLGAAGQEAEAEGIVSSGTVDSFVINGQRITTSSSTVFEGGVRGDFAVGIKVEAEGTLGTDNTLVASKVRFQSSIKLEANVSSVSATSLTLLGRDVAINSFTRLDSGLPSAGAHVEVRAFPDRDGNLIASRVVILSPSSKAALQGPVSTFNATTGDLTILGVNIGTNGRTEFRLGSNAAEQAVGAAAFFAKLSGGVTVVKVRWNSFTSTAAPADEAELEVDR